MDPRTGLGAEEVDRLLATTLYFMTCHASNACPQLACLVTRHLELVASHPDAGARVATICRQLACRWNAMRSLGDVNAGPHATH